MQRGQAMVELIILLPLLLLSVMAAHWLLNLQYQKSTLQSKAAESAWLLTRLASADVDKHTPLQRLSSHSKLHSSPTGHAFNLLRFDPTSAIALGLSEELSTTDKGRAYRVGHSQRLESTTFSSPLLTQSHVIISGAGHAVAPQWTRRRIASSEQLWAKSAPS